MTGAFLLPWPIVGTRAKVTRWGSVVSALGLKTQSVTLTASVISAKEPPIKTYAILSDIQIPYQDKPVLDLVLRFLRDIEPDGVVLNGDICDMYSISTFNKNPVSTPSLNREIAEVGWLMSTLSAIPSIKEKWFTGGNHEDRLRRYIWQNASAFGSVAKLSFPQLFGLDEYGFKWRPYGGHVMLGKLMVTHGSLIRKHAGETARAHFEKYGTSVLVGHSHRLGAYHHRNVRGAHGAYEAGCLCRLDPEYEQHPNWTQGMAVVHVDKGGWFSVQLVPVLDRRTIIYGAQRWDR